MFHLVKENIHLNEQAPNKTEAIKKVAAALTSAGFVEEGYVDGMLEREAQAATYLGIGLAIPHGTTKTRHLVKKTGVQVFCFPNGVEWGDDGEKAYLAIGIAASSDEHLELLRQLTHVLSADGVEERIKNIQSADEAIAILTGKSSIEDSQFSITESSLLLDIPADSLGTLQALNASRLKQQSAVNANFITNVLDNKPNYLGSGVWFNDSKEGNLKNAIAISRTISDLNEDGKPVKLLITMSMMNDAIDNVVNNLASLAFNQKLDLLLSADIDKIIDLLVSNDQSAVSNQLETQSSNAKQTSDTNNPILTREFIVPNENGLHTRPSSVLVKLVKEFKSKVTVANLDGKAEPVSATSLMKIVALGAKKGSRLLFTAVGDDAVQALDAIGKAIESGLGEGI
ncbi:fused PTS fructose transporter subunit IIA/HPr protein [Gilliamella sp. B2776]|uniref:fused PTS fructose transporter subunit IIA/HPr protein n=1 Tax=unclassified Gilliamella TaxID=2685620 RepID=UPI00226A3284|nr:MULTISPECIES: fused PTS fructose transporter subunit IIA/HPr protein [unclassified Gilliamella]MCX8650290.1 fused PTS fructose transporter subunit IIA/HPr protein [Gilliamella sp. B2779]MCX8654352.1 fused PTS fructose transporter subunit IIA/HPr protein [Gilliamella sp. B2737]MCX8664095.1 fused PTS fructose transporter subunit IIA/HPr protein [Gilliamella sp. B2887]MCX8692063.1 fused PTS fructose transporter subunit IIA/HPr protein [Gilliamella sp. B2776]MCX8698976.1 fused PTS fructose tran